jgi:hypothetical protein
MPRASANSVLFWLQLNPNLNIILSPTFQARCVLLHVLPHLDAEGLGQFLVVLVAVELGNDS